MICGEAALETSERTEFVCEKCGRVFLTRPRDDRDHYHAGPWLSATEPFVKCMGLVVIRKARKSG
jgi:hypothetical protein